MAIKYRMVENSLKPGTFYARVIRGRRVDLSEMIPNVVTKTALSSSDVQGVITALIEEIAAILAAGDVAVVDDLATFATTLSGSFDSPDYVITSDNAQLNLSIQGADSLRSAVAASATYEREAGGVKQPVINSFYDVATEAFDQYTPGSIIRIQGDNLKFDATQADEGVFVHDGSTETRLSVYSTAGEHRIEALMPATVTGEITVYVRARYTPGGDLREGRYQRTVSQA